MISLTTLLYYVLPIVAVLGVGGTIVALVATGVIGIPVLVKIVDWILGCRWCLIVLAFLAFGLASFWIGHHRALLECKADAYAAELRNKQIDLDIAHRAVADESDRVKAIEDRASEREQKDNEYIKSLEARPVCALDDRDVGGLSNHQSRAGKKNAPRRAAKANAPRQNP